MRPVMLLCETVNVCNADCVFCPYSNKPGPGIHGAGPIRIDLGAVLPDRGREFSLTPMVGDPLLDRLWMQRIRLLAEKRGRVIPSITTNLYALERYSDQEVCEMLGSLRRINISCYGITPESAKPLLGGARLIGFLPRHGVC